MDTNETGRAADDAVMTLYGVGCFLTLAALALAEQSEDLPGAVAAFASGWYILRLDSRQDR